MNKIRIIDLLEKNSKGDIINQFSYQDNIFIYNKYNESIEDLYYYNDIRWWERCNFNLNDEVEIIGEDKKIEKLQLIYNDIIYGTNFNRDILTYCDNLQVKINELIDELNKLKEVQ